VVYTLREGVRPGIVVALSDYGGRSWGATGRDRLGVVYFEMYPYSPDTVAFAAPTALRLADGDVYANWWCMEVAIVHVCWVRLKVLDDGYMS